MQRILTQLMKLLLWIRRLFVKTPTRPLMWSVEDFKLGKRWAQSQPHPTQNGKTLWDKVHDRREDSCETLHNINKELYDRNKI
jgi:hypothetical protein